MTTGSAKLASKAGGGGPGAETDELGRRDGATGLVTMCTGCGIGKATIIERVQVPTAPHSHRALRSAVPGGLQCLVVDSP